MSGTTDFDVFLSYARRDAAAVLALRERVEHMGLRPFMDTDLRPGSNWQIDLQNALMSAPAIAILIGPDDLGSTQEHEAHLAFVRQVDERREGRTVPVIPVLLPGARESNKNRFTGLNTWVNFAEGFNPSELDRFYFGITGRHRQLAESPIPQPNRSDATVNDAIGNLVPRLAEGGVSFLVGSAVARPPSMADVVQRLTKALRENCPSMPDIPTLDLAGSCLAVDRGDDMAVEDSIRQILGDVSAMDAFPVHLALAELAREVGQRARARRATAAAQRPKARDRARAVQRQQPLVIVTSNYDVLMERALLRQGVRFVRCVQHHTAQTIVIDEYEPDEYGDLSKESIDEIDRVISDSPHESATALKKRETPKLPAVLATSEEPPDVILYKVLGSHDVSGSCFISADQHYHFLHESLKEGRLPDEITSTVRNTRLVFLGYSLFDPVLRLLRYTLLLDRPTSVPCFAVKTQPPAEERTLDHRLEAALWTDATRAWSQKFFVTFIECEEATFLNRLKTRFVGGT